MWVKSILRPGDYSPVDVQRPCVGCGKTVWSRRPTDKYPGSISYLCPDCRVRQLEALAAKLDPTYDPTCDNTWERLAAVLAGLYGTNWDDEVKWLEELEKVRQELRSEEAPAIIPIGNRKQRRAAKKGSK